MTAAAALRRDGYAVMPGLIDPGLLGDFATQLDARLQPPGPGDPLTRLRASQPDVQQLRAAGYGSEAQHRLTHYPPLAAMMADLLGGEVWAQPRRFLRLVPPGPGPWATEPHQDYRYVQGAIDTLTAWIPLHDVPAGTSPLRVVPGSHHRGLWPVTDTTGGTLPHPVGLAPDDARWRSLPLSAGDLVVFHALTVHSTLPPTGPAGRISLDVRYQRTDAPLAATALLAPFECEHPDDPLRWAGDPQLRLPDPLPVVPTAPHPDVADPDRATSRFLEAP
ncbi:phytanoyl-CoA dioxygenase family protein [Streptomyces sp. NPDC050164]|uniref:phytanoyl-CoA dioxygenase family protein n=1 Tax=Streptomyces sp. NPDC050164 TaxID=3365605 RepID=UPI0037A8C16A